MALFPVMCVRKQLVTRLVHLLSCIFGPRLLSMHYKRREIYARLRVLVNHRFHSIDQGTLLSVQSKGSRTIERAAACLHVSGLAGWMRRMLRANPGNFVLADQP